MSEATESQKRPHERPSGELAIRTVAMPADTNPAGDIFGGWVLSQMDMAGGMIATRRAHGRVATVAIATMSFRPPGLRRRRGELLRRNHQGR